MIYFLTTKKNEYTIGLYLQKYGASLKDIVTPLTYDRAFVSKQFPLGTYVFADLELLSVRGRELAARVCDQLDNHGCRVLNHPQRALLRYELLRKLHDCGVNKFNVYRLADKDAVQRFPVFIRHEHFHTGSRTALLHSPLELNVAIEEVRRAGARLEDLLITEYITTANEAGLFRKYGAFIVGDTILARHLLFSKSWQIKDWDLLDEPFLQEEQQFVATNPHAKLLRPIFQAANINYGRIDYSLLGDQPQIWEINTNPMIVGQGTGAGGRRQGIHALFSEKFRPTFAALDR